MSTLHSSLAICSGCLQHGATLLPAPERIDMVQKLTLREEANVIKAPCRKFGARLISSPRVSITKAFQIITSNNHHQVDEDELRKVATYLFQTKVGGQVKVFVRKKNAKYTVNIEVTSLKLSNISENGLVLLWRKHSSDSRSAQGTINGTSETQFIRNFDKFSLELVFEAKQTPFYLSFVLQLFGLEIRNLQKNDFSVPVGFNSGYPAPLGLSFSTDGSLNFAIFSRSAKSVVLCLYDNKTMDKPALELDLDPNLNRSGDIWHVSLENRSNFLSYGYRVDEGSVLDPYAKIVGNFVTDQDPGSNMKYFGSLYKQPDFDWSSDIRPNLPMEKLMVYRLNVRRFTEHDSSQLPSEVAGTFSGLTKKVHHLINVGMNAVLLEPIFPYNEKSGPYYPCHLFSPENRYGPPGGAISTITSMKEMVKTLHGNGIEVLLEVVFTDGAIRGIESISDSSINYNDPVIQQMILDSLRYWVTEFHIDGFCFINASSMLRGSHGEYLSRPPLPGAIAFDPVLSKTKIIADFSGTEPSTFPHWKRWAEVNTKYCDDVRNFLRGKGLLSEIATRLCGSGDVFSKGRSPAFSFNFIARNFGLSLVDLVSFSASELATSQLSWNCGEEGPSSKTGVLERRLKQIRNFLFVLFVSLGVPILNMGDDCGQSFDGSISHSDRKPFDWNSLESSFGDQTVKFISYLTLLRKRRGDILQSGNFLKKENIEWYASDLSPPSWDDMSRKFLAVLLRCEEDENESDQLSDNGDLFLVVNAASHSGSITLPTPPDGMVWCRLVDTGLRFPGFFSNSGKPVKKIDGLFTYQMKSHSCALFEAGHKL